MDGSEKQLRFKHRAVKASLTKIVTYLDDNDEFDEVDLLAKLKNLETLLPKFENTFFALYELLPEQQGESDRQLELENEYTAFLHNCKQPKSARMTGHLSVGELDEARNFLIRTVQAEAFPEEIHRLKSNRNLQRTSKLLSLSAFIDNKGLLRVGGRISNAVIELERKHPLILPYKHHLTELILEDCHRKNFHVGANALLTIVRGEYWPLNGKSASKSVVHNCVLCRRANATTLKPYMADLPLERVNPGRCFENCGVDFCGPIWIKTNTRKSVKHKVYIAVFVCFAVKAIHLELVTDLSSQAFIAALKRFFSRRGTSRRIFSDNGTNFVGAQKELRFFVTNRDIQSHCSQHGVEWHFLPPAAPHMGGLWERSVRSVKSHLKKAMDKMVMTYEEAYTVLTGIEACLNSRPLTTLSDDPNDPTPLTPAHFLIGSPLHLPPEPDYVTQTPLVKRWQRLQQIQQQFWSQWSTEYLSSLQLRSKWRFPQNNIPIGTLVTIKDENLKPLEWRMARIVALHPGKDGVARVATLRLSGGHELMRPLVKVCPILDVTSEESPDPQGAPGNQASGLQDQQC
ncbi:unnamed protein product [Nesidiocoris tenuis]|uniref:Integrase catalytic domain-containing protein n=2 Tax=Nesidiocoris tenuis TaxID=355587 RepID=A0A6H5H8H4_9HEMI|nr:unnamed protein product [Nesidiocoris tenuis]